MRSLLFFLFAIGLFGTACSKKDDAPDPLAGAVGQVVRTYQPGGGGSAVIQPLFTSKAGEWYRYVNRGPNWGYHLPAYNAYNQDSSHMLLVVVPERPTQSREYALDSNTFVMYYRYAPGGGGSYYSPVDFGLTGQTFKAEVLEGNKVRFTFKDLPVAAQDRQTAEQTNGVTQYLTGHVTVQ